MENQKKNQSPEAGETKEHEKKVPMCTCMQDPFADLPAGLRPKIEKKNDNLRKVTCQGCGEIYWTDRKTDVCINCEKKGITDTGTNAGSGWWSS